MRPAVLTAYADTDDPWRSLALALATENTAVGSGTPPDGKLAPVLEDSDEPCRVCIGPLRCPGPYLGRVRTYDRLPYA